MLSQHLITKPVFAALFGGYAFAERNPVSQVMDRMVQALGGEQLQAELETLDGFYRSVARRAEGIGSDEGKQRIITELYEQFFRKAFKKTAESLGIVYTPVEIVDFIIRAADDALRASFGKGLTDEGVHILDPFTGTGTFIVRLLQSGGSVRRISHASTRASCMPTSSCSSRITSPRSTLRRPTTRRPAATTCRLRASRSRTPSRARRRAISWTSC